jgi:putative hydrolase
MHLGTDLHSHTIASGHAFSTLGEMTREGARRGLELLAITDHGPSMDGAPHDGYFTMAARVPRHWDGIVVLFGCEANVLSPDGELDLTDDILSTLDIVGAGLHERTPYQSTNDLKDNTRTLVAACRNSHVDVIVHPYRPRFPVDVDAIAEAAAATGTLLEVNASLFRPLLRAPAVGEIEVVRATARMVEALRRYGGRCVVSSDSHHAGELGFEPELIVFLTDVLKVDPDLVASRDAAGVLGHLCIDEATQS